LSALEDPSQNSRYFAHPTSTIDAGASIGDGSKIWHYCHVYKGAVEQVGFFGLPLQETATSFTYSRTVTGGSDGLYTVRVDLTDKAGNAAAGLSATGFTFDATAPTVTAHTVSPARVKAGQTVTVTFTAGEALGADPTVKLGTITLTKTAQAGNDYTYAYTATGAEGDGTRTVTVTSTSTCSTI
jgi:hypothetical protein